jgi:hypothetical protein
MRLLELFSGTHSVGKVAKTKGYEVVSLDMILPADIKADIMNWDYKVYPVGHFDLITASPVCLWWSKLRRCNIGKKLKAYNGAVATKEMMDEDIEKFGKPMVDRVLEIIDYFKPKYWWIENPQTGKMKEYLKKRYVDADYCMYSNWGYKKRTRFWTNIEFVPLLCENNCDNMVNGKHSKSAGGIGFVIVDGKRIIVNTKKLREKYKGVKSGPSTTKHDRYRIPPLLIEGFLNACK